MNYSPQVKQGVRNGLLTALYIGLVATFMQNASHWFGGPDTPYLTPFIAMTLFVVSALITGSLVLWQPVKMLVEGKANEAGTQLIATGGTLIAALIVVAGVVLLR